MSRLFRYRVTALVLGGLVVALPMLASGSASAQQIAAAAPIDQRPAERGLSQNSFDQLSGGARQVTFGGFDCKSRPDVESMTVPVNSTVVVVNRTGYDANLRLGGASKGVLPDENATEVVFRRGTTAVTLSPDCDVDSSPTPVMITASPSASATVPDAVPAPSTGGSSASAAQPTDSDTPAHPYAGADLPAGHSLRTGSIGVKHGVGRGTSLRSAVAAQAAKTAEQDADLGADPKIKASGTAGSTAPAFSGMPPGDSKKLLDTVPPLDDGPTAPVRPASVGTPATDVATEQLATMESMPGQAPIGLLALTASVCVLGVGTAAIRAIVSQRANRSEVA